MTDWLVSFKFLNCCLSVKANGGWLCKIKCHLSASTSPIINHRMRKQTIALGFPLAPLVAEKTAWLVSFKFLNCCLSVEANSGWLHKIKCHLSASTSPIINHRMRKQTIALGFPLAPLVAEKTAWLVSIKFLNSYLPVKASGGWLRKIKCHLSASTSPIITHRMRKQTIAWDFPLAPLVAEKTAWLVSFKV